MQYFLSDIKMKNYLIASSSPLTESVERIKCCYEAGFAAAILKSAADYEPISFSPAVQSAAGTAVRTG